MSGKERKGLPSSKMEHAVLDACLIMLTRAKSRVLLGSERVF